MIILTVAPIVVLPVCAFAQTGYSKGQCTNACAKVLSTGPAPAPMRKYSPGLISVEIKNICNLGLQVDVTGSDGRDDDAFYHANQTRVQQVEGPNYTSIRVHACMQPGVGEGSGRAD
jgi:hypothetical protein